MRRVVFMMSVSLDGHREGPRRAIDWHVVDDERHWHFNDVLRDAGAFLDGRVTYEIMADFWPTAAADPSASAPVIDFARIWRRVPKIVFSRTRGQAAWNATIAREVISDDIAALKATADGDLIVGGANLAGTFMRYDLIDDYRIDVHPVLLGAGTRLFAGSPKPRLLALTETRSFGNGVVMLRYATHISGC